MKLKFKHQKFQEDAAKAVCDVFAGQPRGTAIYQIDPGRTLEPLERGRSLAYQGFSNATIALAQEKLLENIQHIQSAQGIKPSEKLEGHGINLTVEMETGVGKTYTYIKTMYELNRNYGWSKFIIVVPSIAIREGVFKSFQITAEHFKETYGAQIRFFIYNSQNLQQISQFASDSAINAMIINAQAFNARGKDARKIRMELDAFNSRRPIDVIAKTNPILIIDEPQSVEGQTTKASLKDFYPLFTLRYSATHKKDSIYNMVYRLDAVDAYNQKLVKKIAVKGITPSVNMGTEGYVYLQNLVLSPTKPPIAKLEYEVQVNGIIKRKVICVSEGDNLYDKSKELAAYQDRYVVSAIDGRDNSVEFLNGIKLYVGDVRGNVSEGDLRRIQIRETIHSHLERERRLFSKGIKVLSLFFIDEVAKYKVYNAQNEAENGEYARMFEEEYEAQRQEWMTDLAEDDAWKAYLSRSDAGQVHAGYFSIDKRSKKIIDTVQGDDRRNRNSNDIDAYDLIMKNKERLLDMKEPVRFIFSHSALREGWDNPNVFQICTLKQSSAEIRKRQEVGRGLRLCVNQAGERMDANALGADVHDVNELTVIASESYENFARTLQTEYLESLEGRAFKVEAAVFIGKSGQDAAGNTIAVSAECAAEIVSVLGAKNYIDEKGVLTPKYRADKDAGTLELSDALKPFAPIITDVLDHVYDPEVMRPKNACADNVSATADPEKLASAEFKALWAKISPKSAYRVQFDSAELVKNAVQSIDAHLVVSQLYFNVKVGAMGEIDRKALEQNEGFEHARTHVEELENPVVAITQKYDMVGEIVAQTDLTRKTVIAILRGIRKDKFESFKHNPQVFILEISKLINEQKATAIVEHIIYNKIEGNYGTDIFTEPSLKGRLGKNAIRTQRHISDYLLYDADSEKNLAKAFEDSDDIVLYAKLPKGGFYINTPVGKYTPDWAIVFREGRIKHVYFVAETKGSLSSLDLRAIEDAKIKCARKHFAAIASGDVVYDCIHTYQDLLNRVMS